MADQDVAALAARAIKLAEDAASTQAAIVRQQARSKRNVRLIAVSVLLDITLSVSFLFLYAGLTRVTDQIHQSQLNACGIGNDFRARQIRLWDHVIVISKPPPHETPAQRKARLAQLAAFRAYVAGHFRPVDCTKLYGKPG